MSVHPVSSKTSRPTAASPARHGTAVSETGQTVRLPGDTVTVQSNLAACNASVTETAAKDVAGGTLRDRAEMPRYPTATEVVFIGATFRKGTCETPEGYARYEVRRRHRDFSYWECVMLYGHPARQGQIEVFSTADIYRARTGVGYEMNGMPCEVE